MGMFDQVAGQQAGRPTCIAPPKGNMSVPASRHGTPQYVADGPAPVYFPAKKPTSLGTSTAVASLPATLRLNSNELGGEGVSQQTAPVRNWVIKRNISTPVRALSAMISRPNDGPTPASRRGLPKQITDTPSPVAWCGGTSPQYVNPTAPPTAQVVFPQQPGTQGVIPTTIPAAGTGSYVPEGCKPSMFAQPLGPTQTGKAGVGVSRPVTAAQATAAAMAAGHYGK